MAQLISYAFNGNAVFNFEKCLFEFEGYKFVLYSGKEKDCDVIQCIVQNDKEKERAFAAMNRFLDSFARAHGVYFRWECGTEHQGFNTLDDAEIFKLHPSVGSNRILFKNIDYFIETSKVTTKEQAVALSLLNEAKSSQSIFYSILCYWKILALRSSQTTLKKGNIVEWINDSINTRKVAVPGYVTRWWRNHNINENNVGDFLRNSCLNAIKHIDAESAVLIYSEADFDKIRYANAILEILVEYFLKIELLFDDQSDEIQILDIDPTDL